MIPKGTPKSTKSGSGPLVCHPNFHRDSESIFYDSCAFPGGPDLENTPKPVYCRSKSRVPPFPRELQLFRKSNTKDPQSDPRRHPKSQKVVTGTLPKTDLEKDTKKAVNKL
jgi:hypothetical protein